MCLVCVEFEFCSCCLNVNYVSFQFGLCCLGVVCVQFNLVCSLVFFCSVSFVWNLVWNLVWVWFRFGLCFISVWFGV